MMEWLIIYSCMIAFGTLSFIMILFNKLIPSEIRDKLSAEQLKKYKINLLIVSFAFTLASIIFFIQHYYSIKNLLIYFPIILLAWYAIRKLINNLYMLNRL